MAKRHGAKGGEALKNKKERKENAPPETIEALVLNLELLWLHIRDNARSGKLERAIESANKKDLLDDLEEVKAKINASFDTLYVGVAKDKIREIQVEMNADAQAQESSSVPDVEAGVRVDHDDVYAARADTDALRRQWDIENRAFTKIVEARVAAESLSRDLTHFETTLKTGTNEVTQEFVATVLEKTATLRSAIETGNVCIEETKGAAPAERSNGISACTNTLRVAFETFIKEVNTVIEEIADSHEYPQTTGRSVLIGELERDASLISGKGAALQNLVTALDSGLVSWAETASSPTPQAVLSKMERAARLLRSTDEGLSDTEKVVVKLETLIEPARKHRGELVEIRKRKRAIEKRLNPKIIDLNTRTPRQ